MQWVCVSLMLYNEKIESSQVPRRMWIALAEIISAYGHTSSRTRFAYVVSTRKQRKWRSMKDYKWPSIQQMEPSERGAEWMLRQRRFAHKKTGSILAQHMWCQWLYRCNRNFLKGKSCWNLRTQSIYSKCWTFAIQLLHSAYLKNVKRKWGSLARWNKICRQNRSCKWCVDAGIDEWMCDKGGMRLRWKF